MAEFKYTKDHECVYVQGDVAFVGISEHARDALGDLVFIDFPDIGKKVEKGSEIVVIESVKTAAEVYSPVAGEVVEINEEMSSELELISEPVNEKGWIVKVKALDVSAFDGLMDEAEYSQYLKEVD